MGYNVSVVGVNDSDNFDCSKFIDRNYFNFTASYDMYGKDSVLIKSGEFFKLDLKQLGVHLYRENEFENHQEKTDYFDECKIEIDAILPTIKKLRESIENEPGFLKKVTFQYKENINQKEYFEGYTSSKGIIEDLSKVIDSIFCLKKKGETQIYFLAG
ncbi:MAG: hypothetical protein AAF696_31740 [Bacteroidota bacterium]